MLTEHYPHKLAAIFPDADGIEIARKSLVDAQLDDVVMMHLHSGSSRVGQAIEPEQAATRNHFILDILAGAGIGALLGLMLAGLVAAMFPSVFSNVPVLGPLMVIGYVSSVGMIFGAIKSLRVKEGILSGKVQDALKEGSHVLLVHSADDATHTRASRIVHKAPDVHTLAV